MRKDFTDAVARVDTALGTIDQRVQNAVSTALQSADTDGAEMASAAAAMATRVEAGVARIGPLTSTGMVSTTGASTLGGGAGSDSIFGGQGGTDTIFGGQGGNDELTGNDSPEGGQGEDPLG